MEPTQYKGHTFRSELSFDPLLRFWRQNVVTQCSDMADWLKVIETRMLEQPLLNGTVEDQSAIQRHQAVITPLMSVVFPKAEWENAIAGAMTPLNHRPFYYTPSFGRLMMTPEGQIRGEIKYPQQNLERFMIQRILWLVLDKIYGITHGRNVPVVRTVIDAETGLERYYRILPDWQFLEVQTTGAPKALSQTDRHHILDHIDNLDVIAKRVPAQDFVFRGFTIARAVDVTESEVLLDMARELIEQETMFCAKGFARVQHLLRILFGRPDLQAGVGALQGDQVWVVRDDTHGAANCIFRNSNHVPLAELENSIWLRAVSQGDMMIVPDLAEERELCQAEVELLENGTRAVLIIPLAYRGEVIGTFFVMSPKPNAFTAMDKLLVKPLVPMFAMAVRRGVDDIHNIVQSLIKEKCTALHPSVEWRFRRAAFLQLERLQMGEKAEMETIIFKDVFPLFGQTDIRGSAEARNESIQADLLEQLSLALSVVRNAAEAQAWPLVMALQFRIEERMEALSKALQAEAETETVAFLRREVEPAFDDLARLGGRVSRAIEAYRKTVDADRGFVYRRRRAYEDSVAMLNEGLSSFLETEEAEAQKSFPHYFEKHQSDGVDYIIYLGASLREDGRFNPFHLQNMTLWQLMVSCGMARLTEQIKPRLAVPLETCHLIFYNPTPLAIRFRYDEKRFDVDGAYDVRYEIIKSRLDKATIGGGKERLTQPGRIALVYSRAKDVRDLRKHIRYLQAQGCLAPEVEEVTLDDLPGASGLKALRVEVNFEAPVLSGNALSSAA